MNVNNEFCVFLPRLSRFYSKFSKISKKIANTTNFENPIGVYGNIVFFFCFSFLLKWWLTVTLSLHSCLHNNIHSVTIDLLLFLLLILRSCCTKPKLFCPIYALALYDWPNYFRINMFWTAVWNCEWAVVKVYAKTEYIRAKLIICCDGGRFGWELVWRSFFLDGVTVCCACVRYNTFPFDML